MKARRPIRRGSGSGWLLRIPVLIFRPHCEMREAREGYRAASVAHRGGPAGRVGIAGC
jgi:hypothetical protein